MKKDDGKKQGANKIADDFVPENDIRTPYIPRLNELHLKEGELWIEQGKEVDAFCAKAKELGLRGDMYRYLANHPDAICGKNQYRHYHKTFQVWQDLGGAGKAPNLSQTHYIQVLGKSLGWNEKRRLLENAEKEGLSVRALKQRVKEHLGDGKDKPEKDWAWTLKNLKDATERTLELASWMINCYRSETVPVDTRQELATLVRYIILNNLIDWEELKHEIGGLS